MAKHARMHAAAGAGRRAVLSGAQAPGETSCGDARAGHATCQTGLHKLLERSAGEVLNPKGKRLNTKP